MMPQIAITSIQDQEEAITVVSKWTEEHLQDIRSAAFGYFEQRGQFQGNDWADWLRAEREVLWRPPAEMFENSAAIVLRVAVPGFGATSLSITAAPFSLLIEGTETHQHCGLDARLRFCEFGRRLFRRFDLPARIDPGDVGATLDKGILEIFVAKARRVEEADEPVEASYVTAAGK